MSPILEWLCSDKSDLFGAIPTRAKWRLALLDLDMIDPCILSITGWSILGLEYYLFTFIIYLSSCRDSSFFLQRLKPSIGISQHCFSPSMPLCPSHNASKLHECCLQASVTELWFLFAQPLFPRSIFSAFPHIGILLFILFVMQFVYSSSFFLTPALFSNSFYPFFLFHF